MAERFDRFTHEQLMARDGVNLDITWLKEDGDVDPSSLPDPDTLIAGIVEELTAAPAELAEAMTVVSDAD